MFLVDVPKQLGTETITENIQIENGAMIIVRFHKLVSYLRTEIPTDVWLARFSD